MDHRPLLLVDDEPDVVETLACLFSLEGYEVLTARDGMEAWSLAREHLPGLVITDVDMPRMDGLALCANLRADSRTRHIPIIVSSGREITAAAAGRYDMAISKPAQFAELLEAAEALSIRHLQAASCVTVPIT